MLRRVRYDSAVRYDSQYVEHMTMHLVGGTSNDDCFKLNQQMFIVTAPPGISLVQLTACHVLLKSAPTNMLNPKYSIKAY